jgi:hypothetical protein
VANQYSEYGLRDADVPGAQAWESFARKNGLSRQRVIDGLKWYGAHKDAVGGMTSDEIVASFTQAGGSRWTDADFSKAATFHDSVFESGSFETHLPTQQESASRLAELEAMMKDANSDYYTGQNRHDLQNEHIMLLDRANETAPAWQPEPGGAERSAPDAWTPDSGNADGGNDGGGFENTGGTDAAPTATEGQ